MFFRVYGQSILQTLLAGLCLAFGILTFGDPLHFDRLFFGALVLTALSSYKNANIIGIVCIIAFERLIEESIWLWIKDLEIGKAIIYGGAVYILYLCRFEPLAKYFGGILLISLGAEIYWITLNYPAPLIHWYMAMVALNMLTRYLLMWRVPMTKELTGKETMPLVADWQLSSIAGLSAFVQALVLLEFIIRHIGQFNELLYVYNIMPSLMHGIAFLSLYCILSQSLRLHLKQVIKA